MNALATISGIDNGQVSFITRTPKKGKNAGVEITTGVRVVFGGPDSAQALSKAAKAKNPLLSNRAVKRHVLAVLSGRVPRAFAELNILQEAWRAKGMVPNFGDETKTGGTIKFVHAEDSEAKTAKENAAALVAASQENESLKARLAALEAMLAK